MDAKHVFGCQGKGSAFGEKSWFRFSSDRLFIYLFGCDSHVIHKRCIINHLNVGQGLYSSLVLLRPFLWIPFSLLPVFLILFSIISSTFTFYNCCRRRTTYILKAVIAKFEPAFLRFYKEDTRFYSSKFLFECSTLCLWWPCVVLFSDSLIWIVSHLDDTW